MPLSGIALCHFRKSCYHIGADLSHVFTVYPASEAVEEQDFSIFQLVGADDVFVHNIRHEVLIQPARVDKLPARLLDIFHEIFYRLRHLRSMVNRTELIPSEPLGKKRILLHRPHSPFTGIEVAENFHLA